MITRPAVSLHHCGLRTHGTRSSSWRIPREPPAGRGRARSRTTSTRGFNRQGVSSGASEPIPLVLERGIRPATPSRIRSIAVRPARLRDPTPGVVVAERGKAAVSARTGQHVAPIPCVALVANAATGNPGQSTGCACSVGPAVYPNTCARAQPVRQRDWCYELGEKLCRDTIQIE
jgi:hypothetical protein